MIFIIVKYCLVRKLKKARSIYEKFKKMDKLYSTYNKRLKSIKFLNKKATVKQLLGERNKMGSKEKRKKDIYKAIPLIIIIKLDN